MAARSKGEVCSRLPAENVVSSPTGGMDVCLLWVLCVVNYRSLRRADHSSRGVLPTVVRRFSWSRNLVNEEATAHWGLSRQKQTNPTVLHITDHFIVKSRVIKKLYSGLPLQSTWYLFLTLCGNHQRALVNQLKKRRCKDTVLLVT